MGTARSIPSNKTSTFHGAKRRRGCMTLPNRRETLLRTAAPTWIPSDTGRLPTGDLARVFVQSGKHLWLQRDDGWIVVRADV
jgi:hypothetical protein